MRPRISYADFVARMNADQKAHSPRSHAPRGNASFDALRRGPGTCVTLICLVRLSRFLVTRAAERPKTRSHAERGNERVLSDPRQSALRSPRSSAGHQNRSQTCHSALHRLVVTVLRPADHHLLPGLIAPEDRL